MAGHIQRSVLLALSSAALTVLSLPVHADDTEIFVGVPSTAESPNIMLILDTSGSMGSAVTTTTDYNPSTSYTGTGDCAGISDRVFYSTTGTPPSCGSSRYFSQSSQFKCANAQNSLSSTGIYLDRFIRWSKDSGKKSTTYSWKDSLNDSTGADVECSADNGVNGNSTTTNPYPRKGNIDSAAAEWTATASNSAWTATAGAAATVYSANYIVWYQQFRTVTTGTRMSVMKKAAKDLLTAMSGVNVGLMRYDTNAHGGMVAHEVTSIETARDSIISALDGYSAGGNTPLTETLYESYLYFSGKPVNYGNTSNPFKSVAGSRTPATDAGADYNSPSDSSCQKNAIIYLTDGLPTADYEADAAIKLLPNFAANAGVGCDTTYSNGSTNGGQCLGALAEYMKNTDLRSDVKTDQNVASYFIGFGDDFATSGSLANAFDYLAIAASRGGGKAYQAGDSVDLTSALTKAVNEILQVSTTFTAPTVAVNAFNRTQTLDELYVSMFQPSPTLHWPGNVKKYKLTYKDGKATITDQNGKAAVGTDDYFLDSSHSFWSATVDGRAVKEGGAANEIPDPAQRKVYTYISSTLKPTGSVLLTGDAYSFDTANSLITTAVLGIDGTSDPVRDKLINWARGLDVKNEDNDENGDKTDTRLAMGDPIHAQPGIVIYGGTAANPEGVIYQPTNDGYLHAFDTRDGHELWAFIPQEMLPELDGLYDDAASSTKHYLLDGSVRVYRYDANDDGKIVSADGDKVYIYFGQRRGGNRYYALDVTNKSAPKYMWTLTSSDLPGVGQTWSRPTIARVNVGGASQNSRKLVLVMGGGYDTVEDGTTYVSSNGVGNRIFMVDAVSGDLLWSAGNDSTTDLTLSRMDHSIPSEISVIDLDSDGFADRMYVGDMAAQFWAFDIYNGKQADGTGTDRLVTGGVIASLGSYSESPHTVANTRRFYYPPDVSYMRNLGGSPYFNIAIGSGYREHPLNTTIQDRFYSIRQYSPFVKRTQAQYDALTDTGSSPTIIRDADLTDVTTDLNASIAANGNGWKLRLTNASDAWEGEKVLGGATTFNGIIYFPTYIPSTTALPCKPSLGTNQVYAVNIANGSPAWSSESSSGSGGSGVGGGGSSPSRADRFKGSTAPGILSDVMVLFPEGQPPQCITGTKVLSCTSGASLTKGPWRDTAAQ